MIDANSLPDEIIPIAWSYSGETLPFFDYQKSDVLNDAFGGQADRHDSICSLETGSPEVIMAIMHSRMPHYGVQVNHILLVDAVMVFKLRFCIYTVLRLSC